MNHSTTRSVGILALFVVGLAGCGSSVEDPSVPIAGKVTLNGDPLPEGNITFFPADGQGATAGAPIKDGVYETRIAPGPKTVRITAQREDPNTPPDPRGGPAMRQYLPAKYNSRTTLKTDVPAEGSSTINFELATGRR